MPLKRTEWNEVARIFGIPHIKNKPFEELVGVLKDMGVGEEDAKLFLNIPEDSPLKWIHNQSYETLRVLNVKLNMKTIRLVEGGYVKLTKQDFIKNMHIYVTENPSVTKLELIDVLSTYKGRDMVDKYGSISVNDYKSEDIKFIASAACLRYKEYPTVEDIVNKLNKLNINPKIYEDLISKQKESIYFKVGKLKVSDLKKKCRELKITSGQKKSDYLSRIWNKMYSDSDVTNVFLNTAASAVKSNPASLLKSKDSTLSSPMGTNPGVKLDSVCKVLDASNLTEVKSKLNTLGSVDSLESQDIKYIVHIADLHIRRDKRIDEYRTVFNNFADSIKDLPRANTVVVICGDIFHHKTTQKAEGIDLWLMFLKNVSSLFPIFAIVGNHDVDLNSNDLNWLDPWISVFPKFHLLKYTGYYKYKNITFAVESLLDNGILPPRPVEAKNTESIIGTETLKSNHKYVYLYHGTLDGSLVENGTSLESKKTIKSIGDYDLILLGDIHKYQYMNKTNTAAYSGSLIQQNRGESLFNHGYLLWNIESESITSKFVEVGNPYGFVDVVVKEDESYVMPDIKGKDKIVLRFLMGVDDTSKSCKNTIQLIKDRLGSKVVDSQVKKVFVENKIQLSNSNTCSTYMTTYLKSMAGDIDDATMKELMKYHNKIYTEPVTSTTRVWKLKSLEFKNIFSYGGDKVNYINFSKRGFYKIFGQNYLGKTSIIKIIKWSLFRKKSGIMDNDILNRTSKVKSGYVTIKFTNAADVEYNLHHNIKTSKKVSGITVDSTLVSDKINIKGSRNVEESLTAIIGSYSDFEYVSSINNRDVENLKTQKQFLPMFNHLFQLDEYVKYYNICTDDIKCVRMALKSLKGCLDQVNYTKKLQHSTLQLQQVSSKIEKFKKLVQDSKSSDESKLFLDIIEDLKPTKTILDEEKSTFVRKLGDMTTKKDKILRNIIHTPKPIPILLKKDHALQKEAEESLKKVDNSIKLKKSELEGLTLKIHKIPIEIQKLKNLVAGQRYDYSSLKTKMISMLNQDSSLTRVHRNNILILLEKHDYSSMLKQAEENTRIQKEANILKKSILSLSVKHTNLVKFIAKCVTRITYYNDHINNDMLIEEVKTLDDYIRKIGTDKGNLYKKVSDLHYFIKQLKSNPPVTPFLMQQVYKYLGDKYTTRLNTRMNNDNIQLFVLSLKNEVSKLEFIDKDIKRIKSSIKKQSVQLLEIKAKEDKLKYLKIYQMMMSDKGIPSVILNEITPQIESRINNILTIYTNYQINIVLEGKGSSKSINIYQVKSSTSAEDSSVEDSTSASASASAATATTTRPLTIGSLSGYELFIFNVAFKIILKSVCECSSPDFILIDEVWESIAVKNYPNLKSLLSLLDENFTNILVISHIEEIKEILNDFEGVFVKIKREKSYSTIV